jgi:hypothetical protein
VRLQPVSGQAASRERGRPPQRRDRLPRIIGIAVTVCHRHKASHKRATPRRPQAAEDEPQDVSPRAQVGRQRNDRPTATGS